MNSESASSAANSVPMGRPKAERPPGPYKDLADRIILLRTTLDEGNASAFARRLNISASRLANLESTHFNLSHDVAMRLVKAVPGLTLDWLFLGRTNGLSYELARKLGAAAESKASTTGRRSSAGGRAIKSTSSRA